MATHPSSIASLPSHPLAALSQQHSPHPSKKSVPPLPTSSLIQRPPLPPIISGSGVDDPPHKKQSLDLISEETSPERVRVSTAGSDGAQHKRNNSLLPPTVSNSALSSMLTTFEDDGRMEPTDMGAEDNSSAMEEIQKTHFVRVSFVVPISERSLTSIKSGARTQVSLLRKGKTLANIDCSFVIGTNESSHEYILSPPVADLYKGGPCPL